MTQEASLTPHATLKTPWTDQVDPNCPGRNTPDLRWYGNVG